MKTGETPLRKARKARKLTLDELGRRASVERTKLCRAERGYAQLSPEELGRLAKALRIRVAVLRGDQAA